MYDADRTTYQVNATAQTGQIMRTVKTYTDSAMAHAYAQTVRGTQFDFVTVTTVKG